MNLYEIDDPIVESMMDEPAPSIAYIIQNLIQVGALREVVGPVYRPAQVRQLVFDIIMHEWGLDEGNMDDQAEASEGVDEWIARLVEVGEGQG